MVRLVIIGTSRCGSENMPRRFRMWFGAQVSLTPQVLAIQGTRAPRALYSRYLEG